MVNFLIDRIFCQQLVMRAHGMQPPVVQNDDEVGALHRRDALGNDELGHAAQSGQRMADARLRRRVHGTGGVIENQHLRVLEQRPRDAEALLLPARDVAPALAQVGVKAVGHPGEEFVRMGGAASRPQLVVGGIGVAPL